ncbi:inhibitor of apoptosis protein-like [Mizuhopecten yessoensis]|uniref:Baculoviral IAP repeat-containing protein 3 n=1 Tax=Mizuhopecten yessoensis TaxID=6573 RepID=A0A210Q6J4_MIZYE|nr:inhibitor of apoptosis protein-like [Mizuhopecten yessoensis]XP_021365899.1 inhibitor of apoptosis protein-like [Mizuhopecten yessoensis]XP_021365900.1 inhibitor of apoptosis protein-like [Mizuhopecten yessoensis]OWF44362.1 Baculoviral IAP repeat-containing protein 3 [Mizuhopecten yessoensis]
MPSPLQSRNDHHFLMNPPIQFGTGTEPSSVIHYRGLTSANEETLSQEDQEINVELNESSDEYFDEIADVGVNGREELGTVFDESPQELLAIASNYPHSNVGQDTIRIRQQEKGENGQNRRDVIEVLQRRGYDISQIQTAMDKIWSEIPYSNLTPEAVHREIQTLQQEPSGKEVTTNVVMVGDGLNNEDMKKLKFENQYLRERSICKVCRIYDICIAFFPCGHQICCTDCFRNTNDKCDICQNPIDYGLAVQTDV